MTIANRPLSVDGLLDALSARGIEHQVIGPADAGMELTDVAIDSRQCVSGNIFACIVGRHHDGHDHASEAVARGAAALLVERPLDLDVVQIVVSSVRDVLGHVAAIVNDDPSARTSVIGVTGTNGKTTVAAMIAAVLERSGRMVTTVGTLSGRLTTPEAPALQRLIARAADQNRTVVMEVSSHALVEHRVRGIHFAVAAFTNLGRDHLDLHGTMEEYFRAKASLFTEIGASTAVVNVDDTHGCLLADTLSASGTDRCAAVVKVSSACVSEVTMSTAGTSFCSDGRRWTIPLIGRPHLENAMVAIGVCRSLGIGDALIADGLAAMPPVPGRLEVVSGPEGHGIDGIVDFAHTPDALAALIETCRAIAPDRRLVLVFGCGGDRDRAKRPEMGRIAVRADRVFVTSDNPRSEDPATIIADIMSGVPESDAASFATVIDRREAIGEAVSTAEHGDLIVLAGRGHERVQDIGGRAVEFDDRVVLANALGGAR